MIKIPRIDNPADIDAVFDKIESHPVACCNWPDDYPDIPQVSFKIFHTGENLYIRFEVNEPASIAHATEDNGRVWEDSCVEFFIAVDDKGYYNFETNCIGTLLIGYRDTDKNVTHASADTLQSVERIASINRHTFPETIDMGPWTLTLRIPASALFMHKFNSWDGLKASLNFYKCADGLARPHYLSWSPIDYPKPNFHLPQFFRPAIF